MNRKIKILLLCGLIGITSCKTKEGPSEINYMQNVEKIATDAAQSRTASTIQKGDQLSIIVTAKDMNVVKAFNQNYYSSSGGIAPATVSDKNAVPQVYLVDGNGDIDFPVIGKINVIGKTLSEFQQVIKKDIEKYVLTPTVVVRIVNYRVTVLGEVNRPGPYNLSEGSNSTIFDALGLAGDVTIYAKRDDILLVRTIDGQIVKERINLMDASFINSPAFQLRQNDVIYVSSNKTKEKIARQDPNTGIYMAVAGMIIGLAGIFITIFKK